MGVTISCKKTGESIDMSGGGFLNLRQKVADLHSEAWGDHYRLLTDIGPARDEAWYQEFDRKTMKLVKSKRIPVKLIDFCLQSDAEGRITPGACALLLRIIGDYDDNICYGYAGRRDCAMFRDFKRILQSCVENKSDLIWG